MPPFGRSYQPFIALLGVWIGIVFVVIAVATRADRSRVHRALAGALALLASWLDARYGARAVLMMVAVLAVYGPLRDHGTADLTGLIEFRSGLAVVVADSVCEWLVPFTVAFAAVAPRTIARWRVPA